MNILRAIWVGILLWILIFFEVSILMFGFGLQQGTTIYYVLHIILLALFAIMLSLYYFFRKKRAGPLEGLGLGIILVIVLIILDSIITIPFIIKDYNFLLSGDVLLGELITIIIATTIGTLKG